MTEIKKPLKKPRGKACLIAGKCIACGARCQSACPVDAIVDDGRRRPDHQSTSASAVSSASRSVRRRLWTWLFTPEEMQLLAALAAPGAREWPRSTDEAAALAATLAAYRGVWVFVEQTDGEAAKVSWELLGKGRELADLRRSRTLRDRRRR